MPACSPGSTSIFVFKGYLCKQCLVPSPPQPWRLKTSLLNGASAEPRSSNSQRPGGPGSLPLSEHVLCTQLCLNSGVLPLCRPRWHQGRTVPAASPLPHLEVPRSAAATLPRWFSESLKCNAHATDCPAMCRQPSLGGQPPTTPVPLPPGSSSCAAGASEAKGMFSSTETLYPIKTSLKTNA